MYYTHQHHRRQHDWPPANLQVKRDEDQRAKPKREIRIRNQIRSLGWRDSEEFRVETDIDRWTEKCTVPQERVQRADQQNQRLFGVRPLIAGLARLLIDRYRHTYL